MDRLQWVWQSCSCFLMSHLMLLNFYRWKLFYVDRGGKLCREFSWLHGRFAKVGSNGRCTEIGLKHATVGCAHVLAYVAVLPLATPPSLLAGFVCATMATHADMHVVADGNVNYCKSEAEKPTCLYFHIWTELAFSHAVSFSDGKTHKNLHSLQQNALVQRLTGCLYLSFSLALSACLCAPIVRLLLLLQVVGGGGGGWQQLAVSVFYLFASTSLIGRTCQSVTPVAASACAWNENKGSE